jgi:hypothetical protein
MQAARTSFLEFRMTQFDFSLHHWHDLSQKILFVRAGWIFKVNYCQLYILCELYSLKLLFVFDRTELIDRRVLRIKFAKKSNFQFQHKKWREKLTFSSERRSEKKKQWNENRRLHLLIIWPSIQSILKEIRGKF